MDREQLDKLVAAKAAAQMTLDAAEAELNAICPKVRIGTVMSVPICGWNPHWGCHITALEPWIREGNMRGEDQIINYGAWWDHGVCNAFEDLADRGCQWILTMDYDSMFTIEHVSAIFKRLGDSPDIDAVAAMQCRRGSAETAIIAFDTPQEVQVDGSPIPCKSAHFGLTVLRVEALNRMAKPWMLHTPDANGSYRTFGRIDPDVYFWNKWAEAGNTLVTEPMIGRCGSVGIGHLQPMVSEFHCVEGKIVARHTHFMEWRARTTRVVDERGEKEAA